MGFSYSVEDGKPVLKIAKMKRPLKIKWSRTPPSHPSSITISRDPAGRYHICLLCEYDPEPLPSLDTSIGVDLGLTDLVVTSEGFKSGNPRFLEQDLKRLKRAQRALSRKQRGSSNWYRQKRRVARLHARIKDCRADYLHKLSTRLIRENQTIALESLNVRGMMKNGRLARHIAGAAWSELVRQLEYKAALHGREIVRVGQWEPTSKRCSSCGDVVSELPLSVRRWTCAGCGSTHDRDVNAARNILATVLRQPPRRADQTPGQPSLAVGHTATACGERVSPEPPSNGTAVLDEARIPCL